MFGLIVSDPTRDFEHRSKLVALLEQLDIPLTGFTDAPASLFSDGMSRTAFLRAASAALLQPGQALPMEALLTNLAGDAQPGNVIRRYLFLQLSLLPYLRPGREVTRLEGCFLVGHDLLVAPVSPEDTVDALLPSGVWTELTGMTHSGRLRCMRGYNELPVLVRQNTLLPIGVNDRRTDHDDADRLTLHWYQPEASAVCTLADRTCYHAQQADGHFSIHADTDKSFHLIVHQDGTETLVR